MGLTSWPSIRVRTTVFGVSSMRLNRNVDDRRNQQPKHRATQNVPILARIHHPLARLSMTPGRTTTIRNADTLNATATPAKSAYSLNLSQLSTTQSKAVISHSMPKHLTRPILLQRQSR